MTVDEPLAEPIIAILAAVAARLESGGGTMRTMEVTSRLRKRIKRDFGESGDSEEVCRLVGEASDTERVQAAIVLTAARRLADLHDAIALAQIDWRDVLMNAGLANEDWPTQLDEHLGPTTT